MARTTVATDDFNRADSEGLGTDWTELTTSSGDGEPRIRSNRLTGGSGTVGAAARWTGAGTIGDDQFSSLELYGFVNGGSFGMGVICRAGSGVDSLRNYYLYRALDNAGAGLGTWTLYKVVNAVATSLSSSVLGVADGTRIELEAIGTSIRACRNGVLVVSVTDATFSTGKVGVGPISYDGTQGSLGDNWQGGTASIDVPPPYQAVHKIQLATMLAR